LDFEPPPPKQKGVRKRARISEPPPQNYITQNKIEIKKEPGLGGGGRRVLNVSAPDTMVRRGVTDHTNILYFYK
jgi:hypothetical protein